MVLEQSNKNKKKLFPDPTEALKPSVKPNSSSVGISYVDKNKAVYGEKKQDTRGSFEEYTKEMTKPQTGRLEYITDKNTGRIIGIRRPDGKEILSPDAGALRELAKNYQEKTAIPIGGGPGAAGAATGLDYGEQLATEERIRAAGGFDQFDIGSNLSPALKEIPGTGITEQSIPVLGPIASAIKGAFSEETGNKILSDMGELPPEWHENYASKKLQQEITRKVVKQGLSLNEKVGAIIETFGSFIPFIGGAINKLGDTPISNIADARSNIEAMTTYASKMKRAVTYGADPYEMLGTIREQEQKLIELETRLKLLINASATMRTSSDEVAMLQTKVEAAKFELMTAKAYINKKLLVGDEAVQLQELALYMSEL